MDEESPNEEMWVDNHIHPTTVVVYPIDQQWEVDLAIGIE
jgi:hypothetical protein